MLVTEYHALLLLWTRDFGRGRQRVMLLSTLVAAIATTNEFTRYFRRAPAKISRPPMPEAAAAY